MGLRPTRVTPRSAVRGRGERHAPQRTHTQLADKCLTAASSVMPSVDDRMDMQGPSPTQRTRGGALRHARTRGQWALAARGTRPPRPVPTTGPCPGSQRGRCTGRKQLCGGRAGGAGKGAPSCDCSGTGCVPAQPANTQTLAVPRARRRRLSLANCARAKDRILREANVSDPGSS